MIYNNIKIRNNKADRQKVEKEVSIMKNKIKMLLAILCISFIYTSILILLGEFNICSYVFGICALGTSNVVLDIMFYGGNK